LDAELLQRCTHRRNHLRHIVGCDGADAADAEAGRGRVVEIADQHPACLQRIDEGLQVPSRIRGRMYIDHDRSLRLTREAGRQSKLLDAPVNHVGIGGVTREARWLSTLSFIQLERHVERI
jgi:ABC-type iron transport system FetAB ATPase subunit